MKTTAFRTIGAFALAFALLLLTSHRALAKPKGEPVIAIFDFVF